MPAAVAVVLPVFALVALGYLAARARYLSERAGEGLAEFVFKVGLPVLLFRLVLGVDPPSTLPLAYWGAYFGGLAGVWALALVLARRLGRGPVEAAIAGFATAQSNTTLVGVPLILRAFGEQAGAPVALLVAIHLPITMTAATLLVERAAGDASPRRLVGRLVSHPILVGIALGALVRGLGYHPTDLAEPARAVVDLVAGAAGPCALVVTGAAAHRYGAGAGGLAAGVAGLKLVAHPALVLVLARLLGVGPLETGVAVLFAACPCGVNALILAERYRTGVGLTAAAVALSTGLSGITLPLWVALALSLR